MRKQIFLETINIDGVHRGKRAWIRMLITDSTDSSGSQTVGISIVIADIMVIADIYGECK